ncbi:MAG TPA: citrate synthase/methylcitrate synthase [Nitrolancea sp.]|jgi:citrate synthase|nr:citrate synthase/methylcitrate synthase [Nitrolancea sp.]
MSSNTHIEVKSGLEGVVAAATTLSGVDGEAGELIIAGFPLEVFAGRATFEETIYLLLSGILPNRAELDKLKTTLAANRNLPEPTRQLLWAAAARNVPAMDALRMAIDTLSLEQFETAAGNFDDKARALALVARIPTIIATYARARAHLPVIEPEQDLGMAENYLSMLTGKRPDVEQVRALDTYLNTVVDHGLNASTFTARVIASTGSDVVSALVGAIGALKGPLHGGAPGPALDMVFEIGTAERAEPYIREKLARSERLMGFGHRIYKVRDPRADVLAAASARLFEQGSADRDLYELVLQVERTALALLEEYKPGRRLQTNVEFYTALLLHAIGLDSDLFTPTFAMSRAVGWIAHYFEQQESGRIIRPRSIYAGKRSQSWVPIDER